MAKNPNFLKVRKQAAERRHGKFKSRSNSYVNNGGVYGKPVTQEEKRSAKSIFSYRPRVRYNPKQEYLDALFKGKDSTTEERNAALLAIKFEDTIDYVTILETTPNTILFLMSKNPTDDERRGFFFVERKFNTIRKSVIYPSPEYAQQMREAMAIRWHAPTASVPRP